MGNRLKQIKAEAIAEAERIIATYPRKELYVSCCQVARDMSVGISNIEEAFIPYQEIRQGERIDFPYVIIKALQVDDDRITLESLDWEGHGTHELKLGADISIDTDNHGSSLVPTTKWLKMSFKYVTLKDKMFSILKKITDYHARIMPCEKFLSRLRQSTHDETVVLKLLDELIRCGEVGFYPLRAILSASNNWATGEIMRPSFFRDILLEGIDHGCLAPDCQQAWEWIEVASDANDPSEFMNDMDRWYDILATAVENGNEVARDIMNRIWEPEQIIEED